MFFEPPTKDGCLDRFFVLVFVIAATVGVLATVTVLFVEVVA